VESYGTGSVVKLPGSSPDHQNVYAFGTTYEFMYQDLLRKDPVLYTQNGILHMLDRNRRIKAMPERFQETTKQFDVIFTTEERIYDAVVERLESLGSTSFAPVHVLNVDIKDNHEEATLGAFLILKLCHMMKDIDDLEDDMEGIIHDFEEKNNRTLLHCVHFY
jgi:RNA polymerase II subunit A C-terminal domain phosphatase SSU72